MIKRMIIVFMIVLAVAGITQAATEAEKRAAINDGLAYLATTQNPAGYFGTGSDDYLIAQTGSALLSFLEEKDNWGANAVAYQTAVNNGLNYLFSKAVIVPIAVQPAGNPDGDGDSIGVKFYSSDVGSSRDSYLTGIVLPAIASSGTPDAVVSVGPLAGMTYKQVVQDTVDYFAYGQSDPVAGVYEGGWRYSANEQTADNSTTQWPVIGMAYASLMGVSAPAFVSTELAKWTNYIQNPATGAAGYTGPYSANGEMNETGSLLIQQDFLGWALGDARVQKALGYINQNWKSTEASWDGNFGHPYAMWAIYKGLELTIGLDNMTTITNLHANPGDIDNPNHGWNWWEDYCEFIVNSQATNGSWAGYWYWGTGLATPWYINILAATKIPDVNVPVPGAFLLGSIGLAFACRKLQRRKEL